MNNPCNIKITCPCLDSNPLVGFSAEPPDQKFFVGRGFTGVTPPIGQTWGTMTCQTIAQSAASQQAADLMAAAEGIVCVVSTFQNPATYPNMQQSAVSACPDGLNFTYTVPAGAFESSSSQLDANTQAQTYAQQQADARRICLSALAVSIVCPGQGYSQEITASGAYLAVAPFTDSWAVTAGSLPPGLSLAAANIQGGVNHIIGTALTPGQYNFTLTVTDPSGDSMSKPYSIGVAGITNPNPPQPSKTFFYSYTLLAVGMTTPVFSLTSGVLPPGLNLSSGGVISGTPTQIGTTTFTVTITDAASGVACATPITIAVNGYCVPPVEVLPEGPAMSTDTYTGLAVDPTDNLILAVSQNVGGTFGPAHIFTLTNAKAFSGNSGTNLQVDPNMACCFFPPLDNFYIVSVHNGGTAVTINPNSPALAQTGIDAVSGTFGGSALDAQYNPNNSLVYVACGGAGGSGIKVHNPSLPNNTWQVASLGPSPVNTYLSGRISFDLTNNLAFVGYNDLVGGVGHIGYIQILNIAATLPAFVVDVPVPAGSTGSLVSCVIFCPDNNCLYASYQKFGVGAGVFIGVFNATTHALIAELPVTDGSTLSFYPAVLYSLNGVYNSTSRLMLLAFDQRIQVVCCMNNTLLAPIPAVTTRNLVYVAATTGTYFIDNSGAASILKSFS